MHRLSWVKWYMTDWMISVRRMSWSARGIYMEALSLQFHGERIDEGYRAWQELFPGITERDYAQVIPHFELREDALGKHLVNCRLEAEMDASKVKSDKARANARLKHSGRRANAEPTHSERSAIRGEERREEENREEQNTESCSAHRAASAKPTDSIWWDPSDGWTGITDEDRADWVVAYPAVNQAQELAKAEQWLKGNPEKARKKKWRAFITRWFGKAQERGGGMESGPRRPQRDESHIPEDVHPDDRRLFFSPEGKPRMPAIWRKKNGDWCI